jgi:hypothetical protein
MSQSLTLTPSGPLLDGWRAEQLGVAPGGDVSLRLVREADGAFVVIHLAPLAAGRNALAHTRQGSVSHREYGGLAEGEVGRLARAFAEALDSGRAELLHLFPHLALRPDAGADEARRLLTGTAVERSRVLLGTDADGSAGGAGTALVAPGARVLFDPPSVAALLAPQLTVEGPSVAGFRLRAIYLPPVARRAAVEFDTYVVDLEGEGGTVQLLLYAHAPPERPSFGRAGPFSVASRTPGEKADELDPGVAVLCSWLLALLRAKGADTMELVVPRSHDELSALSWPVELELPKVVGDGDPGGGEVLVSPALNLSLDADCGQACTFCSVKSWLPPHDGGDAEFHEVKTQLRRARARGVSELRLNGIDPLGFSRVVDVVELARDLGFEHITVFTTGRRLADRDFRGTFLAKMPASFTIRLPLYGVTAATHDAVTQAPGSFEQVMAAYRAMAPSLDRGQLELTTLVVAQNLHEIIDILRFAVDEGRTIAVAQPYPMRQTVADTYTDAVVEEQVVVAHLLDAVREADDALREVIAEALANAVAHPCLLFRLAKERLGMDYPAKAYAEQPLLHGTEYRQESFVHGSTVAAEGSAFAVATVACEERTRCALAPACACEHYAVYADLFGLGAYRAVGVAELLGH